MNARMPIAGAIVVTAAAALTACSPAAESAPTTPNATETVTETVEVTATPSAEPDPETLTIPECAALVRPDALNEIATDVALLDDVVPADIAADLPGDQARALAESVTNSRGCVFAKPSTDSGYGVDVLEVVPADAGALMAALREAAGEYNEVVSAGGTTLFLTEAPIGLGTVLLGYAFVGGAWIIVTDSMESSIDDVGALADSAAAAMVAANPGLDAP